MCSLLNKKNRKRFTGLFEVCNAAKQTPKHRYKKIKNKHLVKGHDKNSVIIFSEKKHLHENKTKQNKTNKQWRVKENVQSFFFENRSRSEYYLAYNLHHIKKHAVLFSYCLSGHLSSFFVLHFSSGILKCRVS